MDYDEVYGLLEEALDISSYISHLSEEILKESTKRRLRNGSFPIKGRTIDDFTEDAFRTLESTL